MNRRPEQPTVRYGVVVSLALALSGVASSGAAAAVQVTDVRYDVVFNAETAARREIHVEMSFETPGSEAVSLSLPAWTPGAYELDDFAKNVRGFWAQRDGVEIRWDKADFDTWRVYPSRAGLVTVGFDYLADELDNGAAWSTDDFAFFNGTNLFLLPDDTGTGFSSIVTIDTEADWKVETGMTALSMSEYSAQDYHELVDQPVFVGLFDADSTRVGGRWYHLATYPEGALAGSARSLLWDQIGRMMPPMEHVFGTVPWDDYTVLEVFDPGYGGGSALEHSRSHLGIYHVSFANSTVLASITAHEIFHGWNVKRLRPAAMWPYDYSRPMPTELLWVSEGITDYYADLALVRGGIVSEESFYADTQSKINDVAGVPPVALEDASVSTWIGPRDGTASIYYPKGSLAGLMLDILIRDASDNERSLDDVFRNLYRDVYLAGRGFTEEDWWSAVSDAAGGRSFADFRDAFVDGREPYPWGDVLPLAGLRLETLVDRVPRMGVATNTDDAGARVADVVAGSAAAAAGVQVGDLIVEVGGIRVEDATFGSEFRERFADRPEGTPYRIVVMRDGARQTLNAELRFMEIPSSSISEDPAASPRAVRIRNGILHGTTGR